MTSIGRFHSTSIGDAGFEVRAEDAPLSRSRQLLVALIVAALAIGGCAAGPEKAPSRQVPMQIAGRLDAHVRVEAHHALGKEMEESAMVVNKEGIRQARRDAILRDLAESGLFASVNAPGRQPDLVLRVETSESMPQGVWSTEFKIGASLKVHDPKSGATISTYSREALLRGLVTKQEHADGLNRLLGELLRELYDDYHAGKVRTAMAASRASGAAQAQLTEARAALARADYAAALPTAREALRADPPNAAPVAVTLLHALCDPETAKKLGEEALKAQPTDAALQAALAGTAVTPHPPACQAQQRNRDAIVLARGGQRAEALAMLTEARTLAPGLVPKASYNAAILLEQGGKPAEAVAAYLEAHKGFLLPADQQEALKRLVACAQRHTVAPSDAADRRYRLGIVRAQQKRYPEAVTEFEAALAEAPWLVDAYYNLGLVYDFTNAPAPAVQALRTYLTLAPQSPHASAVKTKIVELEDKLGAGK